MEGGPFPSISPIEDGKDYRILPLKSMQKKIFKDVIFSYVNAPTNTLLPLPTTLSSCCCCCCFQPLFSDHTMSRLHDLRRFSSFNTVCQSTGFSVTGKWTADFDFRGKQRTRNHDACRFSGFAEAELQAQTTEHEEGCGARSPPLWKSTTPLLPGDHCYSYPSPRSRLQAIIDGRKEIMEMIKDLPESSYELSLKDIVDEQQSLKAGHNDGVMAYRSLNSDKLKQQKRKKCMNRQISRSQSMDTGVFLLKMFVPVSWGLKRRSTTGNRSKVSPRPSMEAPEKAVDHKGWRKSLSMGDGKNSRSSSSNSSSTGSNSSIRNRHKDMSFTPTCWSFFKKNRFSRQ